MRWIGRCWHKSRLQAPGSGQVSISWSAVAGATTYNLYYSTTSPVSKATGTKILGVTSPSVVTPLTRGTPYYFVVTAANADGESAESSQVTATPNPPSPTFSQGDLTGTWNVQVLLAGTTPGWYRFTAAVDGDGNVTISNPSSSSGVVIPAIPKWSITPGTGLDNTAGVVIETGAGAKPTFHAKMSSSKMMMVGTSTYGTGTYALHFCMKLTGVLYSDADLANKTFEYNRIYTGASKIWEIGSGSINASNQVTITSIRDSNGVQDTPPANFTTFSVNSTGVVTIAIEPNFVGIMSHDKQIIVGVTTDSSGKYSLRIFQMRGQTYTQEDLAGTYIVRAFRTGPAGWAYATFNTNNTGTTTCLQFLGEDGNNVCIAPYNISISSTGNVTVPNPDEAGGLMSFGKDMVVIVGYSPLESAVKTGSFIEIRIE